MAKLRNSPKVKGLTLSGGYPELVAIGVVTAGATRQQKPWAGFLKSKPSPTRGQGLACQLRATRQGLQDVVRIDAWAWVGALVILASALMGVSGPGLNFLCEGNE